MAYDLPRGGTKSIEMEKLARSSVDTIISTTTSPAPSAALHHRNPTPVLSGMTDSGHIELKHMYGDKIASSSGPQHLNISNPRERRLSKTGVFPSSSSSSIYPQPKPLLESGISLNDTIDDEGYVSPEYTSQSSNKVSDVPYIKIFPLCLARISEGMIYSVILPYINEMIRSFGVEEKNVGVWSAMAVSDCFQVGRVDFAGGGRLAVVCIGDYGAGMKMNQEATVGQRD